MYSLHTSTPQNFLRDENQDLLRAAEWTHCAGRLNGIAVSLEIPFKDSMVNADPHLAERVEYVQGMLQEQVRTIGNDTGWPLKPCTGTDEIDQWHARD